MAARARAIRSTLNLLDEKDLAVTATVNPQFAWFDLSVRPSSINRWGVFAEERIPARRKVIEYTGERISWRDSGKRWARSGIYLFRLNKYWYVDGAVGGSGAEYINHSCDPNLSSRHVKNHILYFSKRQIEPGEELTVDYAFSPKAEKMPCLCGTTKCRGTINTKPERATRTGVARR